MTPFDYPIANLAALPPGMSENAALVSALLTLMAEAYADDNYTPSPGSEPVPATIRAVEAKFGIDSPVARIVRKVLN